jgi:ribose transport system substrate-binding protein
MKRDISGWWLRSAIGIIIAGCLLPLSCGRSDRAKTIDIALVCKALDSEWWQRVKSGAEEAARAVPGVRLAVLAPEREINIDQQAAILEDQITKRISALAWRSRSIEILPLLDRAKSAGFLYHLRYRCDCRPECALSGPTIGAGLPANTSSKPRGKGKVAVIRGIPESGRMTIVSPAFVTRLPPRPELKS